MFFDKNSTDIKALDKIAKYGNASIIEKSVSIRTQWLSVQMFYFISTVVDLTVLK